GLFMSDWGGTNTTVESINAGLDLEMPGPPLRRSKEALKEPLEQGLIDLGCVDASATRLIQLLQKTGRFQDARDEPEFCKDDIDTRHLLFRAACSGIVMLKNESRALPLRPSDDIKKLAIVGPNAKRIVAGGGGSSYINAPYWTSVFASVQDKFRPFSTELSFAVGSKVNRYVPTVPTSLVTDPITRQPGAAVQWFLGHDFDTEVKATTHMQAHETLPRREYLLTSRETNFAFRVRATLRPQASGRHKLSFASIGRSELYLDSIKVAAQSGDFEAKSTLFFNYGSGEEIFHLDLEKGKDYEIRIDYRSHDRQLRADLVPRLDPMEDKFQGIRLGYEEESKDDLPLEAAALAAYSDAAIVVVGRDKEWETEGQDIPQFELPGEQVRLIQEVARVCKHTIIIVQAGTPVRMDPWLDNVSAVLYTWYQGQELGNAVAAVITGDYNPSGRLPVTFPKRIEDCPAFSSFPGEQGISEYREGIYVGYKWWDLMDTPPLFPLGFGLSYNTFEVSAGPISSTIILQGSIVTLSAYVRNTGGSEVPGRQTVIAWSSLRSPARLSRPKKQVCAFGKSEALKPGQQSCVSLELDAYALGVYDPKRRSWIIDANSHFDILLGTTATDAMPAWELTVPEEIIWLK
ncbi:hypothetical protein FDECE_9781, partial [Fusarium decemcellulare]